MTSLSRYFKLDISDDIGFEPFFLLYFPNIQEIDVSDCGILIDAESFVDCVVSCLQLKNLKMINCKQFSQNQMVKMMTNLKTLVYVDASHCQPLLYANAFNIVSSLRPLEMISLVSMYPVSERRDWQGLVRTFSRVLFGHEIMDVFPYGGMYINRTNDFDSED